MSLIPFLTDPRHPDENTGRHRVPVWLNLGTSLTLSILAVAVSAPVALGVIAAANLLYGLLLRPGWQIFPRVLRTFFWQSSLLLLLHYLKFGTDGLLPGFRISCQLFFAFLPGVIFMSSTSRSELVGVVSRFFPPTAAFVLAASLHFIPILIREITVIYQAQVLRGARMQPKDLLRPWYWSDWIFCLLVPATVQALALAGEIATAAKVRDFGVSPNRTCWPGGSFPSHTMKRKP